MIYDCRCIGVSHQSHRTAQAQLQTYAVIGGVTNGRVVVFSQETVPSPEKLFLSFFSLFPTH